MKTYKKYVFTVLYYNMNFSINSMTLYLKELTFLGFVK